MDIQQIPQHQPIDQNRYGFDCIEVLGARTHNLKNINVVFPRNHLVVVTGVSGSGKSSLAFDTIYAEGQRRYRESFSAYARTFLSNLPRPEVDKINGLSPVIAIEQKTTSHNPRSTVGTATEIYDFMRLLFARIADAYSYLTDAKMEVQNEEQMLVHLLRTYADQSVTIMAPVVKGRQGQHEELLKRFIRLGFHKISLNGVITELDHRLKLARYKKHDIAVVIDHLLVHTEDIDRIKAAIHLALVHGNGMLMIEDASQHMHYFSKSLMESATGLAYETPEPNLFSFNTPYGACPVCNGRGEIVQIAVDRIIPDRSLSIQQGAIVPLGPYKSSPLFKKILVLLQLYQYQPTDPVEKFSPEFLNLLLYGNDSKSSIRLVANCLEPFSGIVRTLLKQQERETLPKNAIEAVWETTCPDCSGSRLNKIARSFKINGYNIAQLSSLDLAELQDWFTVLPDGLTDRQQAIAHEIIQEIIKRIQCLVDIGLPYLQLNRSLQTLSGGEVQRIRLATQIGTQLLGVCYVLDEPSIGLHQQDNGRLIAALKALRDIGNTVLVVEHDREMMLEADYLIEIGPQAGLHGGNVIAAGTLPQFLAQRSITADFLTHRRDFAIPALRKQGNGQHLTLSGCSGHNLKNITVKIPLGLMVCVTGVSGSGKSSLIRKTLLPILKKKLYNSPIAPLTYAEVFGVEHIDKVIEVNQSPIGRTPRSNPSTYTGVFTEIRNVFACLPEAKIRGYKPSRFSFNLKEGRCVGCEGLGIQRIEMGLLPEIYVLCNVCKGKRYKPETLAVKYKGKSIADVLDMTVADAKRFFESYPSIYLKLHTLVQVGLGYIALGQHATTLSGGEAQRVKLAAELAQESKGRSLYILDEPSTGLHFQDILDLLSVVRKLVDQGHTVLIVEHNIDIIKVADYIIDMGPEGGYAGGHIVAMGTPEEVVQAGSSHTGLALSKALAL